MRSLQVKLELCHFLLELLDSKHKDSKFYFIIIKTAIIIIIIIT